MMPDLTCSECPRSSAGFASALDPGGDSEGAGTRASTPEAWGCLGGLPPRRTVAFATLGCKLNQVESQELRGLLEARGYRAVGFDEAAQVYVINTCTVTARADYSDRQMIRRAIARNPNALIVATGCYAQTDPQAIARIPGVDLIVGHQEKWELAELLDSLLSVRARAVPAQLVGEASEEAVEAPFEDLKQITPLVKVGEIREARSLPTVPVSRQSERSRAFVKIQDGCQHRCAFCIVPYARGRSRSQLPEVVVEQVQRLLESGHEEVVLTGADMGHYGRDLMPRTTLARLLARVGEVPGLRRLRLSSVLPAYFTDELIEVLSGSPLICPHLHIPLQSGSDRVLRLMRRPYNTDIYIALVERLSRVIPDLGLGTDLIAGFPGESEADFKETVRLIEALPFSYLHVFSYSDRKGTEAARLPDHLPPRVVAQRSKALRVQGRAKNLAFRRALVGRSLEGLVLETREKATGLLTGLTRNYVEVLFDGADSLMGQLINVTITDVQADRTLAEIVP